MSPRVGLGQASVRAGPTPSGDARRFIHPGENTPRPRVSDTMRVAIRCTINETTPRPDFQRPNGETYAGGRYVLNRPSRPRIANHHTTCSASRRT
ncbi:hypothetical protein DF150_06625 [Burkholderia cenocepacia]|nr:hypothetical protein DF150_06625 [Burkholderia cenocepacia]